jgi:hypothetical protein
LSAYPGPHIELAWCPIILEVHWPPALVWSPEARMAVLSLVRVRKVKIDASSRQ